MTSPPPPTEDPSVPFRMPQILTLAACAGLTAGLCESAVCGLRMTEPGAGFLKGGVDPNALWAIPVVDLGILGAVGVLAAGLRRIVPRFVTLRTTAFGFLFLIVVCVLLWFAPQLSEKASLLLAAGIAFQTSRWVGSRPRGTLVVARRAVPWLAGAVAAIGAGTRIVPYVQEQSQIAKLPPAPAAGVNVLLVVVDTLRAASASVNGYELGTTPRIAALARSGVTFDRAVTPAPWTLPTHASMFTGRRAHELRTDWTTPLDAADPTLAEAFAARGYATAGFVGNLAYCASESGLARGFGHYEDYGNAGLSKLLFRPSLMKWFRWKFLAKAIPADTLGRIAAPTLNRAVLDWLPRRGDRPFFVFVNYFDAHDPYMPPSPFDRMFGGVPPADPVVDVWARGAHDAEEVRAFKLQYEGAIAFADKSFGDLLDEMKRRGELDRTLVVVVSDHGEEFDEHGVLLHSSSLYMPSLHVPLVMWMPGSVPEGRRVAQPVEVRELGATALELAGLSEAAERFPGRSLARHWSAGAPAASEPILSMAHTYDTRPAWWPAGPSPLDSVLLDGYHFIRRRGDGHEELFHWETDPWETRDLAGDSAHAAALERCRRVLDGLLSGGG